MLRREFKSWNEAASDDSISIPLEILAGGGGGMVSCSVFLFSFFLTTIK